MQISWPCRAPRRRTWPMPDGRWAMASGKCRDADSVADAFTVAMAVPVPVPVLVAVTVADADAGDR